MNYFLDLGDGLGEETVFESGGFSEQSSVVPPRGKQSEQFVSGVCSHARFLIPLDIHSYLQSLEQFSTRWSWLEDEI